ncbi:exodeoxyribonuclease V subunit alpha [Segetibacter aerophilus]|uniref:RecBCD enzyme subunit RecD n=1 Tax=Segetibacter aerophilus TaxID=670293 RepID=A0A512BG59_9BACT|nr:exodeoxyribonuclease V subunit alpha [Segetibacter aerophilus]GEO10949.1 RecBCD enzyme subunit RecD [Segetibacter aerophilus]
MQTLNNVHQQFAEFFKSETLKPFAFLVSKKLSEGHICIQVNDAALELEESAFFDAKTVFRNIAKLQEEPLVTTSNGPKQPFVLHNSRLYLQRYFNYETAILKRIKAFVESEKGLFEKRAQQLSSHAAFIRSLFNSAAANENALSGENIDWQLVAAISAVLNNFTIITGGPGTGKTTTVAKVLAILYTLNPDLKVALVAPTGKAAMRMAESLKSSSLNVASDIKEKLQAVTPATIHRLLKYVPDTPYFKHNKENPLNYDVVIVDESSMIDVALFAKLLDATGPETKLVLLGDRDQLASVEAGSLFGDLCRSQSALEFLSPERAAVINSFIAESERQLPPDYFLKSAPHLLSENIIELKKSHRFTSDKGIGKFSKAIIKNDLEGLKEYIENDQDEQVTIDTQYAPELFEKFVEGYAEYIREPDIKKALQKLGQLRVLCAVREGEQGLYSLNTAIENYLRKKKLLDKRSEYYENRPIIVTRNYYSLDLFNGDIGIIRADENGVLKAWFEDSNKELKSVLPGYIAESETVFAMTIHKSQGSEYDKVLVVLPDNTNVRILTRELLYTAVTRPKSKVIVQASEAVILQTAEGVVERASGIMERFDE